MPLRKLALAIDGMVCHSCVQSCSMALSDLPGEAVAGFRVSLAENRAEVTVVPGRGVSADTVRDAIEDCGFDVTIAEDAELDGPVPEPGSELRVDMLDNGELAVGTRAAPSPLSEPSLATLLHVDDTAHKARPSLDESSPLPSVPLRPRSDSVQSRDLQCDTAFLRVEGMTCASCVNSITRKLLKVPGVRDAKVALLAEKAEVVFDPQIVKQTDIVAAVDSLGFEASLLATSNVQQPLVSSESLSPGSAAGTSSSELDLRVYGTSTIKDLSEIRKALEALPGVDACFLDQGGRAKISFNPNSTGPRTFSDTIAALGFDMVVENMFSSPANAQLQSLQRVKEIQSWRRTLIVSAAFTMPLMMCMMVLPQFSICNMWLMMDVVPGLSRMDLIGFVLSTPVQFYVGKRFYVASWKSLKHGIATMDVLVTLGTSTAYLWSLISMLGSILTGGQSDIVTFWETPASLITFVVLGRYLENVAKGRTTTALASLLAISPTFATLISVTGTADGPFSERKIPAELVQKNDVLKLMPGEKFPADGVVTWGETTVDESLLSGEARPVAKRIGDLVIGGTVNQSSTVHVRATKVGSEMAISQIVRLVDEAQTSRAPIQDVADRIAGVFVPVVIGLGLFTFIAWMILLSVFPGLLAHFGLASQDSFIFCLKLSISVIVVACPCTLGLATPTAVMVGTGVGAQMGILIKGGAPLETAGRINKVLFDKTGTLTKGRLEVVNVKLLAANGPATRLDQGTFYQLVGLAESYSEHPLGRAVAAYALSMISGNSTFEGRITEFEALPGAGVFARIQLASRIHGVAVGNLKLMKDKGLSSISEELLVECDALNSRGQTVVWAMVDGTLAAMIALADALKPEAKAAVTALRGMGLDVAMVTGDSKRTAEAIARECAIDEVFAEVVPTGKAEIVEQMQASGFHVAFVGDGVNDSIAISKANVGIAVGAGTDVTMEAAQIVLVKDNLLDVPTALHLSRTIFTRIRINFLFSFFYNAVMIPVAMGFLIPFNIVMPPMAAGAAMAMSSVSVVVSSLMLKNYKRPSFCTDEGTTTGKQPSVLDGDDSGGRFGFVPLDMGSDEEALLDGTAQGRRNGHDRLRAWFVSVAEAGKSVLR